EAGSQSVEAESAAGPADGIEAESADGDRIEAPEAEPTGADAGVAGAEADPASADAEPAGAGGDVDGAVDREEPESLELDDAELADAASTDREKETSEAEFSVEPQPISGLARDAWMTVVGEFGEYEIRGKRKVRADETLLHRLFAHLFRTLFSYGKASGVDVGVGEDGFFVEDDGSGVPHAQREYVGGESMTDAKSGAGIQVARRLARRHGWSLKIEATGEGGTRFVVSGAEIIED
ncbi:MAG: ATP-binding protein, partial [Halobacteriales archaeon]